MAYSNMLALDLSKGVYYMRECKESFIEKVKMRLVATTSSEQVNDIINIIIYELQNYELSERTTELIVYDDDNEKIIKSFLACLIIEGKSKGTIKQYNYSLKRLFTFLGNKRYDKITTYDIRAWLASLQLKGNKNSNVRNQKCNISPFFTWLYNDGLIERNPCAPIKTIKVQDEQRKAFSSEEIDTIKSNCENVTERAIVETMLSSGLRVAELCNLKIEDVDFTNLIINVKNGKGGKDRTAFITPVAKKCILKYLKENKHKSEYLFTTNDGTKYTTDGIRYRTTKLTNKCGFRVHPHRFRRTLATDLSRKGMPIQEIQKLLGHSNIETTRKYIDTRVEQIESSYRQLIA